MTLQLNRENLKKLTHPSSEIRLRALTEVTMKFRRAVLHNEIIHFKPGELCKQLIRWFGIKPLQATKEALELLYLLVSSDYGEKAIEQLGLERFQNEMRKIKQVVKDKPKEIELVNTILREYHRDQLVEEIDDVIEIIDLVAINDSLAQHKHDGENVVECNHLNDEFSLTDCEMPWSKPTIIDFNTMKLISDVLVKKSFNVVEISNALLHLQIIMPDFPAEYYLQTPNIFLNLLKLYEKRDDEESNVPFEAVTTTIFKFVKHLQKRLECRSKCINYKGPPSDCTILSKTQLKYPKALELILKHTLKILHNTFENNSICKEIIIMFEILLEILNIAHQRELEFDTQIVMQVHQLVEKYDKTPITAINRLKYLAVSFLLQNMFVLTANYRLEMDYEPFEMHLRDYLFKSYYKDRYERLYNLLILCKPALREKYENLKKVDESVVAIMELLRCTKSYKCYEIVERYQKYILLLSKFKSKRLIEILFDALVKSTPYLITNKLLKAESNILLICLLKLDYTPLKIFVIEKIALEIKKYFGCVLNGEKCCNGAFILQALDAKIIGVPMSCEILIYMINDIDCVVPEIRKQCEIIFTIFLKLYEVNDTFRMAMFDLFVGLLPLLLCCTFSNSIMKELEKFYNPDKNSMKAIHFLRGNIVFLFHRDKIKRENALSCIIYIMQTMSDMESEKFLPVLDEVSDLISADICYFPTPRDFDNVFVITEAIQEISVMHKLLDLLTEKDVEPCMRKTALLQLNILCQSWESAALFCHIGGHGVILETLENALKANSINEYMDAAIPAIGIINKCMLVDSEFRRKLTTTVNFYFLVFRALFLYQHDIQMRQDASFILFQLVFTHFTIITPNSPPKVPKLLNNIQPPIQCSAILPAVVTAQKNKLRAIFPDENAENNYLRPLLAATICGDLTKVNKDYLKDQLKYDISTDLHLNKNDFSKILTTNTEKHFGSALKMMSGATNHETLILAILIMRMQLLLIKFGDIKLPADVDDKLFQYLSKYMQASPGNEGDFLLHEHVMELCTMCISLPMAGMIKGIYKALEDDYHHSFVTLLDDKNISLARLYKLCELHTNLMYTPDELKIIEDPSVLYFRLFERCYDMVEVCSTQEQLQRVRCSLSLLELISSFYLDMNDEYLMKMSKTFIYFSYHLKSLTQTGSQWQRSCLRIICEFYEQMDYPEEVFKIPVNVIVYLSGLCAHTDGQVRTLAWCLLAFCAKHKRDNETTITEVLAYLPGGLLACALSTLLDESEMIIVRQTAGHLFVDLIGKYENFEVVSKCLLKHNFFKEATNSLCWTLFDECLPLEFEFEDAPPNVVTCEIISCYSQICTKLIELEKDYTKDLCERMFMFKLFELLKVSVPELYTNNYYKMAADICQLYTLFYTNNFAFLQRTICRDQIFLENFLKLFGKLPLMDARTAICILEFLIVLCKDDNFFERIVVEFAKYTIEIINLIKYAIDTSTQLLTVTLNLLTYMIIKATNIKNKGQFFVQILEEHTLASEATSVESVTLNGFEEIAIKENVSKQQLCEMKEQAKTNEMKAEAMRNNTIENLKTKSTNSVSIKNSETNCPTHCSARNITESASTKNLEPGVSTKNSAAMFSIKNSSVVSVPSNGSTNNFVLGKTTKNSEPSISLKKSAATHATKNSATNVPTLYGIAASNVENSSPTFDIPGASCVPIVHIFIDIYTVLQNKYVNPTWNFYTQPCLAKIAVIETLSVLLKVSTVVQEVADNCNILVKFIKIYDDFFNEFKNIPIDTFMRRCSESRKLAIITNLRLLTDFLMMWFSSPNMVLRNKSEAIALTKMLLRSGIWFTKIGYDMKLLVLRLCAFLSDHSIIICQQFSTTIPPFTTSMLHEIQKILVIASNTTKVSSAGIFPLIQYSVLILQNCCITSEGRTALLKVRALDIVDNIYPLQLRAPKIRYEIFHYWLEFWEMFSRYPEGEKVRNLKTVCEFIDRAEPRCMPRLLCLRILRNWCFHSINRTSLFNSKEFLTTVSTILTQKMPLSLKKSNSFEEQFLLSVGIWKLISYGAKYVALVRGTKLARDLNIVREQLKILDEEKSEIKLHQIDYGKDLLCTLDIIFNIFEGS